MSTEKKENSTGIEGYPIPEPYIADEMFDWAFEDIRVFASHPEGTPKMRAAIPETFIKAPPEKNAPAIIR